MGPIEVQKSGSKSTKFHPNKRRSPSDRMIRPQDDLYPKYITPVGDSCRDPLQKARFGRFDLEVL